MSKVLSLSILAGLLLSVAGCRANQGASTPPDTKADATNDATRSALSSPADVPQGSVGKRAQPADARAVLVCFGDSLTAGAGTDPGQSYPDYLQVELNRLHYPYRVDNEGVSGATTKDGVERLPDILSIHPAVVVVEFGGNDGLRGLRIEDTRANLDTIVATLQRDGIKVALAGITLPPDYGPDYIQRFNETYQLLARKYRVPMLPFILKNVYGVPGMMQSDQTHATAKGNAIVAKNLVPLVVPLLDK
jgi:acyl-CoA thioesterase-1